MTHIKILSSLWLILYDWRWDKTDWKDSFYMVDGNKRTRRFDRNNYHQFTVRKTSFLDCTMMPFNYVTFNIHFRLFYNTLISGSWVTFRMWLQMTLTNGSVPNLDGLQADMTILPIVSEKFSQSDHHMELREAFKITLFDWFKIGRHFENQ